MTSFNVESVDSTSFPQVDGASEHVPDQLENDKEASAGTFVATSRPFGRFKCLRGLAAIHEYLSRPRLNFKDLDVDEFVTWLETFVCTKRKSDKVFRQKEHVCSLLRLHKNELEPLQESVEKARAALRASGRQGLIEASEKKVFRAQQALLGLETFLAANATASPALSSVGSFVEASPLVPKYASTLLSSDGASSLLEPQAGGQLAVVEAETYQVSADGSFSDAPAKPRQKTLRVLEKVEAAKEKLAIVKRELPVMEAGLEELRNGCQPWKELKDAEAKLAAFEHQIGITKARCQVAIISKERGHLTLTSGRRFEDVCTELLQEVAEKELASGSSSRQPITVLSNVTLGMGSGEIDKMAVIPADVPGGEVQVVALLECKQNMNDLARSFFHYQTMIGWLCGDKGSYDPKVFRTNKFTKGEFDKPASHWEGGMEYVVGQSSFSRFYKDPKHGLYLKGLMFAGNASGGMLTGLDSRSTNLISHVISGDVNFAPAYEARDKLYLQKLLDWAKRSTESRLTTTELLQIYASSEETADHILLLEAATPKEGLAGGDDPLKSG